MVSSGTFLLCIIATAGLTYKFDTALQSGGGTHMRMAIYQPDSIGKAATDSNPTDPGELWGCKDAPASGGGGGAADDVVELTLGVFGGAGGRPPSLGRAAWLCGRDTGGAGRPGVRRYLPALSWPKLRWHRRMEGTGPVNAT